MIRRERRANHIRVSRRRTNVILILGDGVPRSRSFNVAVRMRNSLHFVAQPRRSSVTVAPEIKKGDGHALGIAPPNRSNRHGPREVAVESNAGKVRHSAPFHLNRQPTRRSLRAKDRVEVVVGVASGCNDHVECDRSQRKIFRRGKRCLTRQERVLHWPPSHREKVANGSECIGPASS